MPDLAHHIHSRLKTVGLLAFLAVLFLTPTAGLGVEILYNRLSVNEGLTQSHVTSFAQDADGFIWVGTADGLNRFDGVSVRTYHHDPGDSTTLGDSQVSFLYLDPKNRLWVGSGIGLDRYDPVSDSFHRTQVKLGNFPPAGVHTMMTDDEGYLWVGGSGLVRMHPETEVLTQYPIPEVSGRVVTQLFQDSSGRRWVVVGTHSHRALQESSVYLLDPTSGSFTRIHLAGHSDTAHLDDKALATAMIEDSTGQIWLGTLNKGLFKLDDERQEFRRETSETLAYLNGIQSFQELSGGRLLIHAPGTSGHHGFVLFEPRTGLRRSFPTPIKGNPITEIFLDRFGVLWVGTSGSGAYYGQDGNSNGAG